MAGVSRVLGLLAQYVSRGLFLYGLTCLRRGSTLLALAHTAVALYVTIHAPAVGLVLLASLALAYTVSGMPLQLLYAAIVAAIPASWMALTNLVFTRDPIPSLMVFIRAEVGALHTLYLLHSANPSELSTALYMVGLRRASLAVQLFWRVSSHMLREASEMLQVHGLKGVKAWKSLAMLFVRGEEVSLLYADGLILKERGFKPHPILEARCLLLQAALLAADLAALAALLP